MRFKVELLLSLLNRGLPPLMILIAIAIFEDYLARKDFESYLLLYSAAMWLVTVLFQWQKNNVIKLCSDRNGKYHGISHTVFFLCLILNFVICVGLSSVFKSSSILIFMLSSVIGSLYFFGAHLRIQKKTKEFLYIDTSSQVIRWVLCFASVIYFQSIISIFASLSLVVLIFSLYQYNIIKSALFFDFNLKSINKYIKIGMPLLVMDLSSSGFMYVDRFIQSVETVKTFVISSTVANQSVSILASTILMVIYPRASIYFKEDRSKFKRYWFLILKYSFLMVLTALPAGMLGEILIDMVYDVDFDSNATYMLSGLAIAQSLYYVIVCLSIPLILIGKQIYVASMLFICLLLYVFLLYYFNSIVEVKVGLLIGAFLFTYSYSFRCFNYFS